MLAVLVAYNSEVVIGRSLVGLAAAASHLRAARGVETAVVVVDNASRIPVALPEVDLDVDVLRLDNNVGFAPAANTGARCHGSRLLLFLNPDTQLAPAALTELFGAFDAPETAVAGPLLVDEDGKPIISERPFHSVHRELRTQLLPRRRANPFGPKEYVSGHGRCLTGACLLVERAFFESVGGFDVSIRMYLEDVELCWRAHRAGRDVRFVSDARCVHGLGEGSGGANFDSRIDLHLTLLGARVEFVRRRLGPAGAAAMRAVIAVGALGRTAVVAARRRGWQRHVAVLRWAASSGNAPAWDETVRGAP